VNHQGEEDIQTEQEAIHVLDRIAKDETQRHEEGHSWQEGREADVEQQQHCNEDKDPEDQVHHATQNSSDTKVTRRMSMEEENTWTDLRRE
jgi:hypothetical protein